eukprot:ANDGO_01923.mRNA.1 Adenylate cyclase
MLRPDYVPRPGPVPSRTLGARQQFDFRVLRSRTPTDPIPRLPVRKSAPTVRCLNAQTGSLVNHPSPYRSRSRILALNPRQAAMHAHQEKKIDLDGFLLLEASHAEDPEDATEAVLNNRKLHGAITEDLSYFTKLRYLDVGENNMSFSAFAPLAALEELHMHCNALRIIDPSPGSFQNLQTLNVSYNLLTSTCLERLTCLPALRFLDLSCNDLRDEDFPPDLSGLRLLECLALEKNNLSAHEEVFSSLASIPCLRELNVNYNQFKQVPRLQFPFERLEVLSIANNQISTYESLLSCLDCPSMKTVIAHGNPIDVFSADKQALVEDFADNGMLIVFESTDLLPKKPPVGVFYQANTTKLARVQTTLPFIKRRNPRRKQEKAQVLEILDDDQMDYDNQTEDGDEYDHTSGGAADSSTFFITGGGNEGHIKDETGSVLSMSSDEAEASLPTQAFNKKSTAHQRAKVTQPKSHGLQSALHALKYALEHPPTGYD